MIRLIAGASLFALAAATPALAAEAAADGAAEADASQPQSSRDIVVMGEIGYRNRSDDVLPTLVYDEEYFQRFEPLTAGDALKRVPSVTFLSDVIESDGARLRGLDPGYTQILINGDRVPGSNADRSFFLDRIPAELIKQVEIVRSSSARRTGDAVAGTLNIVLRDAYTLDGGYFRAGGLRFDDGNLVPSAGLYYGGALAGGRILLGANIQGRYNPKKKTSLRYDDSPENGADLNDLANFQNREDQSDTRDGMDYAVNASWGIKNDSTEFELSGSYVRTQRTEDERSFEYNKPTGIAGPAPGAIDALDPIGLLTDNHNINQITQENYSIAAKLEHEWSFGKTKLRATYARFSDDQYETENEIDFNRGTPRFTPDLTTRAIVDREWSVNLEHAVPIGEDIKFAVGGFMQNKDRDTAIASVRNRRNLTNAIRTWDQFSRDPNELLLPWPPLAEDRSTIEEDRRDAYALIEGKSGPLSFEAGLRWENTTVRIAALTAPVSQTQLDYNVLLPSASLKYDIGEGRITASVARTVKRPRFDYLLPGTLLAELGDNDLLGNPLLKPESAWGADLGYEHRIGSTGVIGVNFFYRKIDNLVELANTGVPGSEDSPGDRAWVYQPRNTGSGKAYGVEFDLSASLGFIGLPDTGVFGNLSLIDSKITDELGERRFNGQSKYVYNMGFIQNLRRLGAAFGLTYRKQGPAFDRTVGEEVTTTYGADLEVFVEKRIGDRVTIRFVGSNLLDSAKAEVFNKFNTIGDQQTRDFDEYELESETAGPVFQLIGRFAF
jgi:outer membrane receptor protein involved in Fe transport